MEQDSSGTGQEAVAASPAGANKSKLDTLSKDDLIKFAKKQMAAMQKIKSKCADLEKEVETLKNQPNPSKNTSEDAILIQELTERMDGLLLEKAETQQSLSKCRKDLERTTQQRNEDMGALQAELDRVIEDHKKKIKILEMSIEESSHKHKEEVDHFQNLLKEREAIDRERESEREREREAQESSDEVRQSLEAELKSIRAELEAVQKQKSVEMSERQESVQTELTKAQQEVENLREELSQRSMQHEEEIRALEEDFEIERDRLLLLHEELTEQLALKDSYLQDVQEEDEEPARGSGIAKMLELSRRSQSSHVDGEEEMEAGKFREALEDLQAQNTMLQDELTLLMNLKEELEAELERAREEFQIEREELEFKIDELQMSKEGNAGESPTTSAPSDPQSSKIKIDGKPLEDTKEATLGPTTPDENPTLSKLEEQQTINQDLKAQCEALTKERDSILAEYHLTRSRLHDLEAELGEKTEDSIAMKEQGKLEEVSSQLVQMEQENKLSGSKMAALESDLEQETSEKSLLEAKLVTLTEEAAKAGENIAALEQNASEVMRNSTEEIRELRTRIQDLEMERDKLKKSLEDASEEVRLTVLNEVQSHITELEREKTELERNIEEVMKDVEGLQRDLEDMKARNEKMNEENQVLQEKVSLLTEEKEGLQVEGQMDYKDQLTEKDALVSQLRDEITALQSASLATSSEKSVSGLTERIALLEKQQKDKDEKMNKIKAVAVKAKKELDLSKKEVTALKGEIDSLKAEREKVNSSMKDIIHGAEGYKNMQIDYDRQTEQLDKERERTEAAEKQIAELTKRLSTAVVQTETLTSEKADLLAAMETIRNAMKQMEAQNQDLQKHMAALERDVVAERTMKEHKIKDLSSASKEVEDLTAQLHRQQQQSQQITQELEQLRKEAQQSSLMDMEMADYERLVKELNGKLVEGEECVSELKSQINTLVQNDEALKQEIESLKSQLDQGEEKTTKMKQLLVKTKKDFADAKKQESSLMMTQASLRGELEANQQQLENSKIEVCQLTAERHRLQEQLRSALEQHQRTSSTLQQRVSSLQTERDNAKAELGAIASEFESYKVRVHNVLKQQKSKTTSQSEGDSSKTEREQLSSQVELLRSRLCESQQSLQSVTSELQQLQSEHDTLLERHNKILQETISKEAELRERLLTLQSESVSVRSEASQVQAELTSQIESQRQTYREQLRKLQDEHRATVETLQGQLSRVEEQLFSLQSQTSTLSMQSSRKSVSDSQRKNTDYIQAGLSFMAPGDLQSMAREEGEGMETTETESPSPASTPLPSLEQLLSSPDPKQEPFVWTVEPTKEELSQKLSTVTRSLEHINSLLHETEATNAVLMEQITLLKSEIRRLERNQEREKSVANLEYLKNVLLQFIFLRSGSERQALLPVIHTMLQLSPEEKSKLAAIAQGEEEGSASRGSGWSSYIHSCLTPRRGRRLHSAPFHSSPHLDKSDSTRGKHRSKRLQGCWLINEMTNGPAPLTVFPLVCS
uniref:GRIP domain-containing protein n=1 Tax=Knipowitschia caucasica TaxID=637954 RepID=A0AAV2JZ64_KNICA